MSPGCVPSACSAALDPKWMTSYSIDITKDGDIFAMVFTLPGSESRVLYLIQDFKWVGLLVKSVKMAFLPLSSLKEKASFIFDETQKCSTIMCGSRFPVR